MQFCAQPLCHIVCFSGMTLSDFLQSFKKASTLLVHKSLPYSRHCPFKNIIQ